VATALQLFDALEEITASLQPGSEFLLNSTDRTELFKLTEADLLARHMSRKRAQEILTGIWHQNLDPLGHSLGVTLACSDDAPPLLKIKEASDTGR
jgi:hypothetical protein